MFGVKYYLSFSNGYNDFYMNPEIKIFNNTEEIATEFANTLLKLANESNGKPVHIALSGGSTPKAIFQYLAKKLGKELAKNEFHFWWGDDRCVPPTDDDSNFKWANELWLAPIGFPIYNIHRILGENDPKKEAIRYSKEINTNVPVESGLPVFDVMLLGLGEDGHTASIFPDQMSLLNASSICEVAVHPDSGQKRITITGRVINNSKLIAFLATGAKKAMKVKEVITDKNKKLPAAHIYSNHGKLIWWLDNESASLL